jgi:hypothetical protein
MLLMKLANMSLCSWFLYYNAEKELSLFAEELEVTLTPLLFVVFVVFWLLPFPE